MQERQGKLKLKGLPESKESPWKKWYQLFNRNVSRKHQSNSASSGDLKCPSNSGSKDTLQSSSPSKSVNDDNLGQDQEKTFTTECLEEAGFMVSPSQPNTPADGMYIFS